MIYVGIDPGLSGAIAALSVYADGTCIPAAYDLPRLGSDLDWREIHRCLESYIYENHPPKVGIEKVNAMPKQGVASSFRFGMAYGGLLALCHSYPTELIPPRKWKAEFQLASGKGDSLLVARRLFPFVDLTKKKDHNKAEALLIAEYLRRREFGRT